MSKFLQKDDDWIGETFMQIMHGTLFEWPDVKTKNVSLADMFNMVAFFL